jgi:hypothetical protein
LRRLVYLDEAGDLNLTRTDEAFPIFALTMLVVDEHAYAQAVVPAVTALKLKYLGHDGVILHSRDIRKAQAEFGFLTDGATRDRFLADLTELMRSLDYTWITTVIRKQEHRDRYGPNAANPYDLALTFCLERLLPLLESEGQKEVTLVAEARGKREDAELELVFLRTISEGTAYVARERFQAIRLRLVFARKCLNVVGNQLADLVCYPVARHVLDPKRPNLPYEALGAKMYRGPGAVRGLKVFP